ncbi:tolloid-like protein 2 isoform X3 [Octopus bimaculoides]|nr:tolloid-like protein 2 isoform X3 [Octopus bimaculoides]XP_014770361.1 tolloid-like protein 2 isoform X3 [Octopus bimaculoides]XP_052826997.1 tolloid-like protein 2 isoform X3 [Octopus bimaculoides]XP_052826998.1 tolloid-like protein 2 isoform X3 [Octopus bimaculoides]UVH70853.1 LEV10 [Octopus bimaculoides]|eukprot:XP_014770360.1 PREDICTED: tolloid-like protein 2 isoform X1 [Octopus bimaculoides]
MHHFEERLNQWTVLILCLTGGFMSDNGMVSSVASQGTRHFIGCEISTISHHGDSQRNGSLHSPNWPNLYPNSICHIYKFTGRKSERVKLNFTSFNVQGIPPMCSHDYLDIYAELQSDSDSLLDASLTGRFCGDVLKNLPRLVISSRNVLMLGFYTDDYKADKGFSVSYEFIDGTVYDIGAVAPDTYCGYTIRGENKPTGYIVSPTYPGIYPDNLFCYYKLQGKPKQRIRLKFEDFSLFHGGEYCPFDYVKIYDGYSKEDPVIGVFCGHYKNLTLFSSKEALYIEFKTRSGRVSFDHHAFDANADFKFERRGFNITYEFSKRFVNLSFIPKDATHILGTECDVRVVSSKESNGTISSPGYHSNFPANVTCHYYIDGLMDKQNLEKARIKFMDFDIPGSMPYCMLGYLAVNLKGQISSKKYHDKFCGELLPPELTSENPRLVLILNTHGAVRGRGFLARYEFITDYNIPGEAIKDGVCSFLYDSKKTKEGSFNSPRHPGLYFINLDCIYIFRGKSDEKIAISFEVFNLPNNDPLTCKATDYLEIYQQLEGPNNYSVIRRYCGKNNPGPILTEKGVKILFHSDDDGTDMGFRARYKFIRNDEVNKDTDCSNTELVNDRWGGLIQSPEYPLKYKPVTHCEWQIQASSNNSKILLQFTVFKLEGPSSLDQKENNEGCPHAVVRIYSNSHGIKPDQELCGSWKQGYSYVVKSHAIKLSFLSSSRSLGAKGFRLSWTEIRGSGKCDGFKCVNNGYCIAPQLKCNNLPNCGTKDNSDESTEAAQCPATGSIQILHIAVGTSISSFFCIILVICGFYHRKKFGDRKPPEQDHVEVRYVSSSGCNTTDRLLTQESPKCQRISIV